MLKLFPHVIRTLSLVLLTSCNPNYYTWGALGVLAENARYNSQSSNQYSVANTSQYSMWANSNRTVAPIANTSYNTTSYNIPSNPNRSVGPIANTSYNTTSYNIPSNPNRSVGPIATASSSYNSTSYDPSYVEAMRLAHERAAETMAQIEDFRQQNKERRERFIGSTTKMVTCDKCGGAGRYNHSGFGNTFNSQCPVCGGSGQITERKANIRASTGSYGR